MTLAEVLGLVRGTLRTSLAARWPDFPPDVNIGDRYLGEHVGGPRVVLCHATGIERAPRDLGTNPQTIAERAWDVEAHVWVAHYDSLGDDALDVQRVADLEGILDEVSRAFYQHAAGMLGGGTPADAPITVVRDVEALRFGEEAVAMIRIGIPVTMGATLVPVENAESAVEGDGATMYVNTAWGA